MVDCVDNGSSMCDGNDNFVYDNNCADRYPGPNPFAKGERCAVYDPTAPAGRTFAYYRAPRKTDVDIVTKLNEIKTDAVKSAVVKLNEIALKMKKEIKYEVISISGAMHAPVFTVCVSSGDIVAYGNGASKREAKINAAIELLNMLDFSKDNNSITTTSNESIVKQTVETKLELNPVGVLQEKCMAYHLHLPYYEYFKEICNESNELKFIAICSLNTFRSKGMGLTKQAAKKQAASLLYDQIKNLSPEDLTASQNYVKYTKPSEILLNNNQFDKIKSISDGKCNVSESMKFTEMFIANLRLSTKPSINKLKILDFSKKWMNAVDLLEKLGKEERFTSTYVKLHSMTPSTQNILLQVSFFPLIINVGEGNTLEEAQEAAAFAVLSYLKMLLNG